MIAVFLLLVTFAIVLGVGVVANGLYLLIVSIVVFLGALILGALRMLRRPGRRPAGQCTARKSPALCAR